MQNRRQVYTKYTFALFTLSQFNDELNSRELILFCYLPLPFPKQPGSVKWYEKTRYAHDLSTSVKTSEQNVYFCIFWQY